MLMIVVDTIAGYISTAAQKNEMRLAQEKFHISFVRVEYQRVLLLASKGMNERSGLLEKARLKTLRQ